MKRVLIIMIVLATVTPAVAAPTAEDFYIEGQAAYDRGDFTTAIERWQASYQLSNAGVLLYNIAQAQRLSGDCRGALATYRRFIAIDQASDQQQFAEDFVRELEPTCSAPAAADPQPNTGAELNLARALSTPKNQSPGRILKISGLVTGGAGLLSLAAGLAFGRRASSLADDVSDACRVECDWALWKGKDAAGRQDAAIGHALDVVGVAAIVGGAVMYYLGGREGAVTVSPRLREGGAVVAWSGSW